MVDYNGWNMLIFRCLIHYINDQNRRYDTMQEALQFTQGQLFRTCTYCFKNRQNFEEPDFEYCKN